jgi:hypothetical protein
MRVNSGNGGIFGVTEGNYLEYGYRHEGINYYLDITHDVDNLIIRNPELTFDYDSLDSPVIATFSQAQAFRMLYDAIRQPAYS